MQNLDQNSNLNLNLITWNKTENKKNEKMETTLGPSLHPVGPNSKPYSSHVSHLLFTLMSAQLSAWCRTRANGSLTAGATCRFLSPPPLAGGAHSSASLPPHSAKLVFSTNLFQQMPYSPSSPWNPVPPQQPPFISAEMRFSLVYKSRRPCSLVYLLPQTTPRRHEGGGKQGDGTITTRAHHQPSPS